MEHQENDPIDPIIGDARFLKRVGAPPKNADGRYARKGPWDQYSTLCGYHAKCGSQVFVKGASSLTSDCISLCKRSSLVTSKGRMGATKRPTGKGCPPGQDIRQLAGMQ